MTIALCLANVLFSEQQEIASTCFNHEECSNPSEFCAWVQCQNDDGTKYMCGRCKPCSMCLCNTNATDFQCPRKRCPLQPVYGIEFWQGIFYNATPMQTHPNVTCIRRFAVVGNFFSMLQIPISTSHPAKSATLNAPISSECQALARSGVLSASDYESNGVYSLKMIISSEGNRVHRVSDFGTTARRCTCTNHT
jgi:hypothetical protein